MKLSFDELFSLWNFLGFSDSNKVPHGNLQKNIRHYLMAEKNNQNFSMLCGQKNLGLFPDPDSPKSPNPIEILVYTTRY